MEARELETSSKKSELGERLKVALENDGFDPETVLFNDEASTLISSISANMDEKISAMEENMGEKISAMKNDKSADILLMRNDITLVGFTHASIKSGLGVKRAS